MAPKDETYQVVGKSQNAVVSVNSDSDVLSYEWQGAPKSDLEFMEDISLVNKVVDDLKPSFILARQGELSLDLSEDVFSWHENQSQSFDFVEKFACILKKNDSTLIDFYSHANPYNNTSFFFKEKPAFEWLQSSFTRKQMILENITFSLNKDEIVISNLDNTEEGGQLVKLYYRLLSQANFSKANFKKFTSLTQRELQVIALIMKDYNYKQISEKLYLSPDTIKTHKRNIYKKLDINSVSELVKFGLAYGIDTM